MYCVHRSKGISLLLHNHVYSPQFSNSASQFAVGKSFKFHCSLTEAWHSTMLLLKIIIFLYKKSDETYDE